jgi:hypothetical protein
MMRTSQDICRAAQVGDLVTRSISGHATAAMQQHYSTVGADEQERGLCKVIQLIQPQNARNAGGEDTGRLASPVGRDDAEELDSELTNIEYQTRSIVGAVGLEPTTSTV